MLQYCCVPTAINFGQNLKKINKIQVAINQSFLSGISRHTIPQSSWPIHLFTHSDYLLQLENGVVEINALQAGKLNVIFFRINVSFPS